MQKIRIDDKTEIIVKDGVDPEVARKNFIKRYMNNLYNAEKSAFKNRKGIDDGQ
jgi:hypothetical protein